MTRDEALEKLISVRHQCFVRGILKKNNAFRGAFRTLNRLYVEFRDGKTLKGVKTPVSRRVATRVAMQRTSMG